MAKKNRLKAISLFSGCGGLDQGLHLTNNFKVIWANDIFEPSCNIFAKNFKLKLSNSIKTSPGIVCCNDIGKINFLDIGDPRETDLVVGGPPCQDFSQIRGSDKKKGLEVKRGRLYVHFVRALASLQPKAFIFENVKGLVSANNGNAYKQILDDFRNLNLNYDDILEDHKEILNSSKNHSNLENYEIIFSEVINFSKLGVPQQRERLIIIGIRKDLLPDELLQKTCEQFQKKLIPRNSILNLFPLTPIEIFTGKTFDALSDDYKEIMLAYKSIAEKIIKNRKDKNFKPLWLKQKFEIWEDYFLGINNNKIPNNKIIYKIINAHKAALKDLEYLNKPIDEFNNRDESQTLLTEQKHITDRMDHIPPGENHRFVEDTPYKVIGLMSNIYKRIHPLKPSPTVIARGGGGTWGYHYLKERQKLTNRERARLQTFPDKFSFIGKPSDIRRAIGEAVPPLASKKIGKVLYKIIKKIT